MIQTGKKYRLIEDSRYFKKDTIITTTAYLIKDWYICEDSKGESHHVHGSRLELIEEPKNNLYTKAENLWQTLAYVKQAATVGIPLDLEAIEKILIDNRPALDEK